MFYVRTIIAIPLVLFGLFAIGCNWYIVYQGYVRRRPAGSLVPLVGPLSLSVGLLCAPQANNPWIYLLPFALDWGTIPNIALALICHWRRADGH